MSAIESHYRIDGTSGPWVTVISGIAKELRSKDLQDDALTLGTQSGGKKPEEFAAFRLC